MAPTSSPVRRLARHVLVAGLAFLCVGSVCAQDVLTHHNNNARTGASLNETTLTAEGVASGRFRKLWGLYTDGQVVAQPLYVSGLNVDTSANPAAPPVR